jgi:hypothetical protein
MVRLIYCPADGRLSPKKRREAFLRAWFAIGSASFAAACAGVDRTTPYVWRREDPEFALAWEAGKHWPHDRRPDREIGKRLAAKKPMNDKMLMYALRRADGNAARISTPTATKDWVKTLAEQVARQL